MACKLTIIQSMKENKKEMGPKAPIFPLLFFVAEIVYADVKTRRPRACRILDLPKSPPDTHQNAIILGGGGSRNNRVSQTSPELILDHRIVEIGSNFGPGLRLS